MIDFRVLGFWCKNRVYFHHDSKNHSPKKIFLFFFFFPGNFFAGASAFLHVRVVPIFLVVQIGICRAFNEQNTPHPGGPTPGIWQPRVHEAA